MTPDPVASARFLRAVVAGNASSAREVVVELQSQGRDVAWIIAEVLAPAQAEIGRRWENQALTVAEEHLATAITAVCLETLVAEPDRHGPRGRVLITGAEGEWHTLPPTMVAQVWRAVGWDVLALTPSLPPDELADLVSHDHVNVGAVSCALPANLIGAWQAVCVLRQAGLHVLVGGAAFQRYPQTAAAMGADSCLQDAVAATALLEQWIDRPRRPRPIVAPPGWPDAASAWQNLNRVVHDAMSILSEFHRPVLGDDIVGDDIDLLARVATVSVAFSAPLILIDHLGWYRHRLDMMCAPQSLLAAVSAAVSATLPDGAGPVRSALRTALAKEPPPVA